jgi:hypothetical protein
MIGDQPLIGFVARCDARSGVDAVPRRATALDDTVAQ